jgi:hypothetical protein
MQRIFTRLLTAASTTSLNLPVKDPTFQLPRRILVGPTSFLTLHARRGKCEDPCSLFTTPGRRCSAPLRLQLPDPCSLIIVPGSRYDASPRGRRSGPCSFNTTPRFRCSASLRGLRPNEFLMGFISIRVADFAASLPDLMHPPLPELGTGYVETTRENLPINLGGVDGIIVILIQIIIALPPLQNVERFCFVPSHTDPNYQSLQCKLF